MTEQAALGWIWTIVIGGGLWLACGFIVAAILGPAIGLGGPDDPRRAR